MIQVSPIASASTTSIISTGSSAPCRVGFAAGATLVPCDDSAVVEIERSLGVPEPVLYAKQPFRVASRDRRHIGRTEAFHRGDMPDRIVFPHVVWVIGPQKNLV